MMYYWTSSELDMAEVRIRGLRVYPYPRIYPFSIRGSGTDRVHFSRVGSGTGMVVAGTGVPGFYPYKPHILSLQCHQYIQLNVHFRRLIIRLYIGCTFKSNPGHIY